MTEPIKIPIKDFPIRLGKFLKFADLVGDGLEAKIRIQYGEVQVNDLVEIQRGKQLVAGDTVSFGGKCYLLVEPAG